MPVIAAVLGTLLLAFWFEAFWPASPWPVLPRGELVAKGRQFAKLFGVNVDRWQAYTVAKVSKSLTRSAKGASPLSLRITYVSQEGQRAEVGLDSSGLPLYWRAPEQAGPKEKAGTSEAAAAEAAFRLMAGRDAGAYRSSGHFMGEDSGEENYSWKKPRTPSGLRETITATTKDEAVLSVERKIYLASDQDDEVEAGKDAGYWDLFGGISGLSCVVAFAAIVAIYVLWLARRTINHQFPLRMAGVALFFMALALFFGADWQKSHSLSQHEDLPVVPVLFLAASFMVFVAVGRGISAAARPQWVSLEQLCLLAARSKAAGRSLAAGALFGPLLAAVPFLIAGCGLFPQAWVLPRNLELLYSHTPLLDSLNVAGDLYLIGLFGFVLPALERLLPARWLRWLVVTPLGIVFFADRGHAVSGPVAAPLAAGLLTLAIFWFVWHHFDLLAVLTLQFVSGGVMTVLALAQKRGEVWGPLCALLCVALLAFWLSKRGNDTTEGDPLASIPGLTGFRAEREKLQAEFSLARRAQQEMLPPTPEITGYTVAASCTPSLEVGGDLYDFLRLPDGRIGIGVADVSGKGVPAALYMTLTKGLLASVTHDSAQLVPVVEEVNRHLHAVTRKKVFVTMALGFLDLQKRELQYVRAGHNPIVWRQAAQGQTVLVSPGGLGLGITAGRVFSTQLKMAEMHLAEGDAVVFYSDGITEAMNRHLELFGEQRLLSAVDRTDSLNAAATRDSILAEVRQFLDGIHPQDDMTLVVLRVGADADVSQTMTDVKAQEMKAQEMRG